MYIRSVIILLVMFLFLPPVSAQSQTQVNKANSEEEAVINVDAKQGPIPLEQLRSFANVFMRIKHNYVKEVGDEELLDYAIQGMLGGLDPHSAYLKDERFESLDENTHGKYGGLGIEVVMENGLVKIITPVDDTPAAEAGLKSGDIIIRIDGSPLRGKTLNESTKKMRGEPGTSITLTVLRETESKPLSFTFNRAVIQASSVRSVKLVDQIGYIRVSQFQLNTATEFRKKLKKIRDKTEFGGLIIDLRNNPGGLLNSAISIADAFIRNGLLVSTRGRNEENNKEYHASANDMLNGKPIVVLINEGSASASEIVAGALQDHSRALIMGTQSFGKGSVQTVMEIDKETAVKLTTARYFTPSGRSIQAEGIVPDIVVSARQFKKTSKDKNTQIKEKDLDGHLVNDDEQSSTQIVRLQEMFERDYQLNEAYNVLKGMLVFGESLVVKEVSE